MDFRLRASACAVLALLASRSGPLSAQGLADLAGSWTLNRQLSQFPKEIGFSASFAAAAGPAGSRSGGSAPPRVQTETAEVAQLVRFLTDEVRTPYDQFTIAVTPSTVTIAPDRAAARVLPLGRPDQVVSLGPVSARTSTVWDTSRLVVAYQADSGRVLRYTYSLNGSPRQLIVDVEFVERGGGDKVRRIYDPTPAGATPATASSSRLARPAPGAPAGAAETPPQPASKPPIDQRPDAALMGLTILGVVVESVGADAAKCGVDDEAIERAVTARLTGAGFRVERDSDADTYLYVNINTVSATAGLCVSRYDVTLYSHTAAALAHTSSPVLVQVELLRRGGIAGGGPAGHGDSVLKSVVEYVDQFTTRIRSAGK